MGSGIAGTWPLPLPPLAGAGSARNSFSSGMGLSFWRLDYVYAEQR